MVVSVWKQWGKCLRIPREERPIKLKPKIRNRVVRPALSYGAKEKKKERCRENIILEYKMRMLKGI